MSNKSSFKEKFKLFLFFLDDIENYSKIKNEIVLPTNIAQILNPITSASSTYMRGRITVKLVLSSFVTGGNV